MLATAAKERYCIVLTGGGSKAEYAKTELEKYIYLLTGTAAADCSGDNNDRLAFLLTVDDRKHELGEEGYEIHTSDDFTTVTICAFAEQGLLYGVYGLLEEHYSVGFYFSGDAIPQQKKPLPLMAINESRIPEQYIRGFLPWTNFPQSATSYSIQDWMFIIDQMTRMRMNFINIHNYNGEFGHNEMFHNIMQHGEMSRNWNATVSRPHAWGIKGWDVNKYLFGGSELFDDYDFGADAALHNDCLGNIEVFQKGSSEFRTILNYAKKRGVKLGLGLDLNLVTSDYGESADHAGIARARIRQIIADYPNLDYLMLYRSENSPDFDVWNHAFQITYREIKEKAANIRIAVSGWGLDPDTIIGLPKDVIAAPISGHGVNDKFPDGRIYGEREFWACPWAERDYHDSVHFAPYHTHLSSTIACYQSRSRNTKGLMMLTWRISDAVDAKLSYVAQAPWDVKNLLSTAKAAYGQYAVKCYGPSAAEVITDIINEQEAYATNASECLFTPPPALTDRSTDLAKAKQQLAVIDAAIAEAGDKSWVIRLKKLRCRIQAVKSFCILDQSIETMTRSELESEFGLFVKSFIDRVDDISTLGNLFSVENRYVQEWFCDRADKLPEEKGRSFLECKKPAAGSLRVLMISPVTALDEINVADFKAIVLSSKKPETLVVSLFWRAAGDGVWREVSMERRVKNIFGVRIPTAQFPEGVAEYYVKATEETGTACYPETAPALCMAISSRSKKSRCELSKPKLVCEDGRLRFTVCGGDIHWYRIYRGTEPAFAVGPQSLVTYVYRDTLTYCDVSPGFDGACLEGDYYYKVSAVDIALRESEPSDAVLCKRIPPKVTSLKRECTADDNTVSLGELSLSGKETYLFIIYGATGVLTVDVWIDGVSKESGTHVGTVDLCSTGRLPVHEIGQIPLTKSIAGTHEVFVCIRKNRNTKWETDSFYLGERALREPVITTSADCFGVADDCSQLCLSAADHVSFQVKTIDGRSALGVNIDGNGVLTMESPQTVRVISKSTQGVIRERLITAQNYVRDSAANAFDDFWLISSLIGCDESVEVGGLVYGYEYVCRVKQGSRVIYTPARSASGSFRIPQAVLAPNHQYEVAVTASNAAGASKTITHHFQVSAEGSFLLNEKNLLGLKENSGECTYIDEWKIRTQGRYAITAEGLRFTTGKGDRTARFSFCLPHPYTPQLPHLLVKAEAITGSYTFQVNGIPIVGPKENNEAVRKDLRIFGFEPGRNLEVSFIISTEDPGEAAETIFKRIQLLPDHIQSYFK